MTTYEGYNGQVELDGDTIVISRDGMVARAAFAKGAPRSIPDGALGGIRVRQPTRLTNGWIQLILGASDAPDPGRNAPSEPDTIMFTYAQRASLDELHAALSSIVDANRARGLDPASIEYSVGESRLTRSEAQRENLRERQTSLRSRSGDRAEASDRDKGRRLESFAAVDLYEYWISGGSDAAGPVAGARATVDTAGGIDRRLSLTRVVATGGVGLFWKKKVDMRELYLLVEGSGFAFVRKIDPKQGMRARAFAMKINQTASAASSRAEPKTSAAPATVPTSAVEDPVDAIRRLAALRDEGLLTDEEFVAKKTQILGI